MHGIVEFNEYLPRTQGRCSCVASMQVDRVPIDGTRHAFEGIRLLGMLFETNLLLEIG